MANTIRIKRRASGGSGAPASLANAELAYNEVDDVLYYGKGDSGGSATSIQAIAGVGAVVTLTGNQTIAGVKTFSSTIQGSISGNAGTATTWATARDLSLTGDATGTLSSVNGSANVSAALTLATVNSNVGTFTKLTVNAKGLVTAAANAVLNDIGTPTADYGLGGFKLTGLADPTNGTDAANKQYVDAVAQGLDIKASVRVATTANITLSGTQTIDGIALTVGDRVIVKNQTTTSQNGFYVVASGAWSRSADADTWNELISAFAFVESGTTQGDTSWVCTVDAGGTLGTTPVTFAQFSGAGTYTAGDGLQLIGNEFSAKLDGSTLSVSASGLRVSATYAGNTSLVTLGTVTTGTWNATAIGVAYGGIGLTSAVTGLLKGNGTSYSAAVAGTDYLSPSSTIDGGTF